MSIANDAYNTDDLQQMVDAFQNCGWESIFNDGSHERYSTRSTMLSDAARKAKDNGNQLHARVLNLLSSACFIMLAPERPNEPFRPIFVGGGGRSVMPDDFTELEVDFFANIVELVSNPFLKSRLADLVWHRKYPRDVRFALAAIDAYIELPLRADTWFSDVAVGWQRAIKLSHMISSGTGNRIADIESSITTVLGSATTAEGFFGCWLADTLLSNGLGKGHSTDVTKKLETLAHGFNASNDYYSSGRFFNAASKWAKYAGDDEKSADE